MTQDQTLKAYYSTMEDADLLKLVKNRRSYIEVAQKLMIAELERRRLSLPREPEPAGSGSRWSVSRLLHRAR